LVVEDGEASAKCARVLGREGVRDGVQEAA
jgi:hypothetical protein